MRKPWNGLERPNGDAVRVVAVGDKDIVHQRAPSSFTGDGTCPGKHTTRRVEQLLTGALECAGDLNWCVNAVAKRCGVSLPTLERHVLAIFGECPRDWLLRERLAKALPRLAEGATIKEVSAQLGYKNQHHFSRVFNKVHGCPPSVYRKRMATRAHRQALRAQGRKGARAQGRKGARAQGRKGARAQGRKG